MSVTKASDMNLGKNFKVEEFIEGMNEKYKGIIKAGSFANCKKSDVAVYNIVQFCESCVSLLHYMLFDLI